MKTKDCFVARDLMPLYQDELLSKSSVQFLEAHLRTCDECRDYYENYIKRSEEAVFIEKKKSHAFLKSLKRARHLFLGILLGVVLVLLALTATILLLVNRKGKEEQIHFEETYVRPDDTEFSSLLLFPEEVQGTVEEYHLDAKGGKLYKTREIYLCASYTEDAYEIEKNRLLSVKNEDTGMEALYTEDENILPMIYAMLYDEAYEYALLNEEEKEIFYIYIQGVNRSDLQMDAKYLPKDFCETGVYFETERDSYRIYPKDFYERRFSK